MIKITIILLFFVIILGLALFITIRKNNNYKKNINRALQAILDGRFKAFYSKMENKSMFSKNMGQFEKLINYFNKKESELLCLINDTSIDFNTEESNDALSINIKKLYQQMQRQKKAEIERKKEEENYNWATKGEADIGEILRNTGNSLKELSYQIIKFLVDYTGSIQGGMFVLNEDNNEETTYNLEAAVAFDRKKLINKQISIGESLVGRCAYEKLTIYMEDVPEDYVNITSGLGSSNPRTILLVPAKLEEKVWAIIEIVSFEKIPSHKIEFIEKVGKSIASTINNVKTNENTQKLLEQSKSQSEELAAQEEEMRQNLEELQATQEEVARLRQEDEAKNKKMIEEVELHKNTLTNILDNIPDKIFLKDSDCRMLIVNKAVLTAHNAESKDLLGKNDFDFIEDKKEAQKYYDEEQDIIKSGKPKKALQKEVINNTGVYLDSIKIPFYIDYLGETGILGIQHDVTNIVELKEENEKLKKQVGNKTN